MTFLSPIRKGKHVIKVFAHRIGLTFCLLFCQEKSKERVCIKTNENKWIDATTNGKGFCRIRIIDAIIEPFSCLMTSYCTRLTKQPVF